MTVPRGSLFHLFASQKMEVEQSSDTQLFTENLGAGGSREPLFLWPLHAEPHRLRRWRGGRGGEGVWGLLSGSVLGLRPRRKSRGDPAAQPRPWPPGASWELGSV